MSVLIDNFQAARQLVTDDDGPELIHTRWGYIITSRDAAKLAMRTGYLFMRYVGIVLVLAAVGLWILPGTSVHGDVIPFKLGVSVLFVILGIVGIWNGVDDRCEETQIDLERREVRRGVRRANGQFVMCSDMALRDAGDLYMVAPSREDSGAVLYLRCARSDRALELAKGPEDLLFPLQRRIAMDLKRASAKAA